VQLKDYINIFLWGSSDCNSIVLLKVIDIYSKQGGGSWDTNSCVCCQSPQ